ncbi:MAG: homoserine dehydrogenase [Verrucomicrobia bacterium]|nr:MAG: homoserine dehydrogenase [Verrucomicrobiota bacterium]
MYRKTMKIGLCGFGVVGQGVWKHLNQRRRELDKRLGVSLEIARIAVRDPAKERKLPLPRKLVTTDPFSIAVDPEIPIVCELMGGTDVAREITLTALRAGKIVVTANKALLSEFGPEIFEAARTGGGHILFEASVGGGIPIIKALREGLVANRFRLIYGILNGTCNYILTRMENEDLNYTDVLADAKRLGYAEADESLDVDGWDSAHKASILAFLAHGTWVRLEDIGVDGIRRISPSDFAFARSFGLRIKLLSVIARNFESNDLSVSVRPMLLPERLVLANVNEVYNGICVAGDVVGTTLYIGRGAGQDATASAVIGDLADAALVLLGGKSPLLPDDAPSIVSGEEDRLRITLPENQESRFYLRLTVKDASGVLARVSASMASNRVSIASVLQSESDLPDCASLILTTHRTNEKAIQDTANDLKAMSVVVEDPVLLQIAEFED